MQVEAGTLYAELVTEKKNIPVVAKCASKFSLLIRFLDEAPLRDGAEFPSLLIQNGGEPIQMGRCRLIVEADLEDYDGRLIFVNEIYDLETLILKNELISLQSDFLNLPLVLAHKARIRQIFKDYTADLSYDLSVYKELFDHIDSQYAQEPSDVQKLIQNAIIRTEGTKFMRMLDDRLVDLEQIVSDFEKEEHERHGFYFRKQLWHFLVCSPFMARTNLKPRGYAGDSQMMTMIYSNRFEGESTFSKLMHKHPVEHPAAQAVRNRRKLIAGMIRNHAARVDGKLKVLSVACGPFCEIQDILSCPADIERYQFTLLDQDSNALSEASHLLGLLERKHDRRIDVRYLNESVRTMLTTQELREKWGQFHVIYSMGLFDYLTPPVGKAVLNKLYHLLEIGGELVVGNFHVSNPSRRYMEYWLDWVLYYRTEPEFKGLLASISSQAVHISFDETGIQMLLHVKKTKS